MKAMQRGAAVLASLFACPPVGARDATDSSVESVWISVTMTANYSHAPIGKPIALTSMATGGDER